MNPLERLPLMVLFALVTGACGGGMPSTTGPATTGTTEPPATTTSAPVTTTPSLTTTTTSSTTTTAAEAVGPAVYLILEDKLVPVYRESATTADPAVAALDLLLLGPTAEEAAGIPALETAIPTGTSLLGVKVADGNAVVDLSQQFDDGGGSYSMFARLAQVVFTLTRLPEVGTVEFWMEGSPVNYFSGEGIKLGGPQRRDDYYDLLPLIFVEAPAWGEPVLSPIEVRGLSNVFEAVSQVMLTDDDGATLFEDSVMATCGTGCWGDWLIEIPYSLDRQQFGALIVWEYSAQDGSRINVREYPIRLG